MWPQRPREQHGDREGERLNRGMGRRAATEQA
jgi:hypothetical protein